jgi:RNA polymerase sigma-70 factor, ECF subfamily
MKAYDDVQLVEAHRRGNGEAFNELVRRYQERIYWVVRRLINDHDDSMDLAQDVFIRAFQNLGGFRGDAQFFTWIYKIAVNLSLNHIRKRKLRNFLRVDDYLETIADNEYRPDIPLEKEQFSNILQKAIATLPTKQKAVFLMRYFDEMPYEEIAKVLNRTTGALKANYFHAVRKIEDFVKNEM